MRSRGTVLEVLKEKHPEAVIPEANALEGYAKVPELVPVDVTSDTVVEVVAKLSGAGGSGRVDAVGLQQWLLRFGPEIQALLEAVAEINAGWRAIQRTGKRIAC